MLMKLESILTQKPALPIKDLLKQILPVLKDNIISAKLSKILCEENNNNKNNFIRIDNNHIIINVANETGKILFLKTICLVANNNNNNNNNHPFLVIIINKDINVRKIIKSRVVDFNLFEYIMRSFVIINQYQYECLFKSC